MTITAVTTWEGTPASITLIVAGSKAAIEVHESLGARNPRLLRDLNGPLGVAHYAIDFDSVEAYGTFMDGMLDHEWWSQTTDAVADAYPELQMKGTTVFYNALE